MDVSEMFSNMGSELVGTAGATGKMDFATATPYDPNFRRRGVLISNCGASATLYVKMVTKGGAAPTVTSTNFHAQIPAGSAPLVVKCQRTIDIYIMGTQQYCLVEVG